MRSTALLLISVLTLTACDHDSRTLVGDYRLRRGYTRTDAGRTDTVYSLWDTGDYQPYRRPVMTFIR